MKVLFVIIASCISVHAANCQSAQRTKPKNKIKFSTTNQVGLLNGGGGASYSLQTINGIALGKWGVGVGVGIDNYINRSIPVFLQITRDLTVTNNRPFIYGGAGLNYTWLTDVDRQQKGLSYSTTPGLIADAGLGYKIKLNGGTALLFSAGYSYKQSKETVESWRWLPWQPIVGGNPEAQFDQLNSQYRRIVIKVGIQL